MSVRLDDDTFRALAILERAGLSRSEAIRQAILETAVRRRSRSALQAEVTRIAADPDDRAEMLAIAREIEELRDPW